MSEPTNNVSHMLLRRPIQLVFLLLLLMALSFSFYLKWQSDRGETPDQLRREKDETERKLRESEQRATGAFAERDKADRLRKEAEAREEIQRKLAEKISLELGRLEHTDRVAEIGVHDPTYSKDSSGKVVISGEYLTFVELDENGKPRDEGRKIWIDGTLGMLDTAKATFDPQSIKNGEPGRGHSVVLFRGLYGKGQMNDPQTAHSTGKKDHQIDVEGAVPRFYSSQDPEVTKFQEELWRNFWEISRDPVKAKAMHITSAEGEIKYRDFDPKYTYRVTLKATGELTFEAVRRPAADIIEIERKEKLAGADADAGPATNPATTGPTTAPNR